MIVKNRLSATTRKELRAWLKDNSTVERECWVVVSNKPEPNKILYLDAVEEALCFGWIDSVRKRLSPTETGQRLSPRVKGSNWTELNKERARRLERLGLMTEWGRKVLPDMSPESFKIDPIIEDRLKEDIETYTNFQSFPELYCRIRIDTIHSVKKNPELFESRLKKLVDNTKAKKMYGAWNDNGRLIEEENDT